MGGASRTLFRLTVVSPTVFTFKPSDLGNLTSVCFFDSWVQIALGLPLQQIDSALFSGGGTKGVAFAGALLHLYKEKGIDWGQRAPPLKCVGGVSIGSFFALLLALGCSVSEIVDMANRLNGHCMISVDLSRVVMNKEMSIDSGDTMHSFLVDTIHKKLPGCNAETLTIAQLNARSKLTLMVFATDLDAGEIVCIDSSNTIVAALKASMALPGLLPPIPLLRDGNFKLFADGGIINNFPLHLMPTTTLGFNLVQKKYSMSSIQASSIPFFAYLTNVLETVMKKTMPQLDGEKQSRTIFIECGGTCGAYEINLSDVSRRELFQSGINAAMQCLPYLSLNT
jgi:predicted acylesterase/phospholipase RssA